MYCNYCGKSIQEDANVCAYCGRRVGVAVARRKLIRPRMGRKVAGVCVGFSEYLDIDVTVVRLIAILMAIFFFPLAEIAYVVAWIVMPEEPEYAIVSPATATHVTNPQV